MFLLCLPLSLPPSLLLSLPRGATPLARPPRPRPRPRSENPDLSPSSLRGLGLGERWRGGVLDGVRETGASLPFLRGGGWEGEREREYDLDRDRERE